MAAPTPFEVQQVRAASCPFHNMSALLRCHDALQLCLAVPCREWRSRRGSAREDVPWAFARVAPVPATAAPEPDVPCNARGRRSCTGAARLQWHSAKAAAAAGKASGASAAAASMAAASTAPATAVAAAASGCRGTATCGERQCRIPWARGGSGSTQYGRSIP